MSKDPQQPYISFTHDAIYSIPCKSWRTWWHAMVPWLVNSHCFRETVGDSNFHVTNCYTWVYAILTNETMWASPLHHAPQDSIENSPGFKCIRIPQQNFGVKMKSGTDLKGRRSWYSRAPVLLQKGFDKSWGAVSMVTKRKPREGRRLLENLGGMLGFLVFLYKLIWQEFAGIISQKCVC